MARSRRAGVRLAAIPVLGLCLAGPPARAAEPVDRWPLLVRDGRSVAGLETSRIAGPLYERWRASARWDRGERGMSLRPLFAHLARPEGPELEFLYPLGGLARREAGTAFRLTPLVDGLWRAGDAEAEPRHGWTFLLGFGGRTPEGEVYGGLFPVAGVAKQRFGLSRLDFVLFPLFARSRDERGFVRTTVLWPFFSFGRGGGRSLLRIWPFYGHDRREGHYDRRFALWPFAFWRTERSGAPNERRARFFLPFYGESRSASTRSYFVLGPLYMRSENSRTGARVVDAPWPLVRVASRPPRGEFRGSRELRVEPFFRHRRGPGYRRSGALFGATDRRRSEIDGIAFDSFRLFFVTRFERSRELESGATRTRRDLWPLFHYRDLVSGSGERQGFLRAPWLLPIPGEGFERHWLGFQTLYERRWLGGESRSALAWGLARRQRAEGYALDAVSWLFQRERLGGEETRLRILGVPASR